MPADAAFLLFVALSLAAFVRAPRGSTAVAVFLAGWVLLPPGPYPAGSHEAVFPYWIVGSALPSDMLLSKAWVAPVTALLGWLGVDRSRWRRLRPSRWDALVLAWCCAPLLQSLAAIEPSPSPLLGSAYLSGTWGATWLLGRCIATDPHGPAQWMAGLAAAGLACLPFSLLEATRAPWLYAAVYGQRHPFTDDGATRYLGYRPLGFFENGNQSGLWLACCALAAFALALATAAGAARRRAFAVALAVGLAALASQSVGAVVSWLVGAALLAFWHARGLRRAVWSALAAALLAAPLYYSNALPIRQVVEHTAAGQTVKAALRQAGRQSLAYRVARDQDLLPEALAHPWTGSGHWDWWRASAARPWSLPVLVLGQFGILAAAGLLALWLGPALRQLASGAPPGPAGPSAESPRASARLALGMALVVVMAVADSALNSFVFFPAVALAGALASLQQQKQPREAAGAS